MVPPFYIYDDGGCCGIVDYFNGVTDYAGDMLAILGTLTTLFRLL